MDNLFGNTSTKTLTQLRAQASRAGSRSAVAEADARAAWDIRVYSIRESVGPVGTPFRPGAGLTGPVGVRGGANGP